MKSRGVGLRVGTARVTATARPTVSDDPGSSFDLSPDEPRSSPGAERPDCSISPQFLSTVIRLVRKDSHV